MHQMKIQDLIIVVKGFSMKFCLCKQVTSQVMQISDNLPQFPNLNQERQCYTV